MRADELIKNLSADVVSKTILALIKARGKNKINAFPLEVSNGQS
jgi:hypothetical protein